MQEMNALSAKKTKKTSECLKCHNLNKTELNAIGQAQKIEGLFWYCNM